jgi:hypothetical protein
MEEEASEPPGFPQFPVQGEIAVLIVPQDGVADEGKMAADLVHPAGAELQFQQGKTVLLREEPVGGLGAFHIPPDGKIEPDETPFRPGPARADRQVPFDDTPAGALPGAGKEGGKPDRRLPGFSYEDEAGGILVQTVNQERPGGKFLFQEPIQGNLHALPPLYRQSRRFVEDQAIVVFKQNRYPLQNTLSPVPNVPMIIA